MANKRLITSAIWEDDWFGQLDFFDQALWIGLFSKCADDQGRLLDNAVLMRAAIFPYKDIDVARIQAALAGFEQDGRIHRYEAGGKALVQILNWWAHQPQQWASESKWEAPAGWVDHVRTRVNGQYHEANWRSKAENAQDNATWTPQQDGETDGSGERSGEGLTYDSQVGGHVPVPVPVPVPNSTTTATRAREPKPPPTEPEAPNDALAGMLFRQVENTGVLLSPTLSEAWLDAIDDHRAWLTPEFLADAFKEAAASGVARPAPRYIQAILDRCAREGVRPGEGRAPGNGNGSRASPIDKERASVDALNEWLQEGA